MALSAHEGAVFLEHGAEGEAAASLLFTTKPYEHTDGRRLAAVMTAVELPGTRGARVGRERKFDVGRARYKSI